MKVGYVRVSTHEQNISSQKDALKDAGCKKIFQDKVSGIKNERPGLIKAASYLRKGDTLIVWRLDRLGRSLKHLIEIISNLEGQGIGFQSLQESIDTTTSGGRLIFHIFGALAEFERNLIQERTKAGLDAARSRGRKGGRPRKLDKKRQELLYRLYADKHHTIREICEMLKISKSTLYHYLGQRTSSS